MDDETEQLRWIAVVTYRSESGPIEGITISKIQRAGCGGR
jgi:hypothetical protein